jgi:protease I
VTTVAFLVAHEGIEQVELTTPWKDVQDAGATPLLVSNTTDPVQGFEHLDRADTFEVDRQFNEIDLDGVDLLVLPGGVANPDHLRQDEWAVKLVGDALEAGVPVAAICHAPWTLIETGKLAGRTVTSYPSLKTDLQNAGATWVDEELVVDREGKGPLITSRNPDDLPAFGKALVEVLPDA